MRQEIDITPALTAKQAEALRILKDATTIELLFGGGAGGGKSRLMCMFGIDMSLSYEGIRGLIGRDTLKGLKESTLLTFFDVCKDYGLVEGYDYVYNQQESTITFLQTGSVIYLKELGWLPGDPNYDRLGSTEYTWAGIDEAQQITKKAKDTVRSRIRYKLAENGLIPKLMMSCNPTKNFLYEEFYKPSKEGTLPSTKRFIQALAKDNMFIDPSYLENLRGLDLATQERLLYGNWEYDDDPAALMRYDAIQDIFTNIVAPPRDPGTGKVPASAKYIIVDVARFGADRTTISYWEGLSCRRMAVYTKLPTVPDPNRPGERTVAGIINEWRELYGVPLSHTLVDEDGVGGGVVDYLHCKGFMGGRKPFPMPKNRKVIQNFGNLRAQCSYKLAEYVNDRRISAPLTDAKLRELLVGELEQIKAKDHDKDGKLMVVPKEEIKEKIGRSPDISDNLMMRMFFEFDAKPAVYSISAPAVVPTVDPAKPAARVLTPFERGQ